MFRRIRDLVAALLIPLILSGIVPVTTGAECPLDSAPSPPGRTSLTALSSLSASVNPADSVQTSDFAQSDKPSQSIVPAQPRGIDAAIESAIRAVTSSDSTVSGPDVTSRDPVYDAVVRVIAVTPDGIALGSGTLVALSEDYGLILTNWHVVGPASGPIRVAFSGGYRSVATVLKTDAMWDLAALAIRRPPVRPLRIAPKIPVPGEPLRIAGYGEGAWRCIEGVCTQFVAPDPEYPFEMVELSVVARHGDSGGPILNRQNELAGVLFGAGDHCTTGSHCGRIAIFMKDVMPAFHSLPEGPLPEVDGEPIAASPRNTGRPEEEREENRTTEAISPVGDVADTSSPHPSSTDAAVVPDTPVAQSHPTDARDPEISD
ncbi:MAG: serine protease, partial [Planctomycetia bacterium]|nr:serine protease [Planctomycetia bacterium]